VGKKKQDTSLQLKKKSGGIKEERKVTFCVNT
jgi:hypothetical protein